jgi:hypothetical protein
MKVLNRILGVALLALFVAGTASADTCAKGLTGVFTAPQSVKLCKTFGGSGSLIPSVASTYDIGSASLPFNNIYGNNFISSQANKTFISSNAETAVPAGVSAVSGVPRLYVGTAGNSVDAITMAAWGAVANGNNIDMFKTRATSSGAPTTIVNSGDITGNITFFGANGTGYTNSARIQSTISGTPGASNDMPGKLEFDTTPDGSGTLAAVLTLDQDKSALFTGTVRSSATADIGWVIYTGLVNATCNTQCTSACVVGMDTEGAKTTFVACNAGTAENCLCAGAS